MKHYKVWLFLCNFIILLSGGVVLFVGTWLLIDPTKDHILELYLSGLLPNEAFNVIAYTLLGLGCVISAAGVYGCRAAIRENQCILSAYMCLLGILIILEVFSVIFTELATRRILSGLETRLIKKLDQYGHDSTSATSFSQSLDFAQYKFNCCGIHNDSDYNGTQWWRDNEYSGKRRQVPLTCCILKNAETKNTGSPMSVISRVSTDYEKPWIRPQPKDETACQDINVHAHKGYRHISGCLNEISTWLQFVTNGLIMLAIFMAGSQIAGFIAAIYLCRRVRITSHEEN